MALGVRWVQVAPVGVTLREVRFEERSGAVIGLFHFPVLAGSVRGARAAEVFTGQPVRIQRIEPHGAFMTMISVARWTGDESIDECDWFGVCEATRRRLKLVTVTLLMHHKVLCAAGLMDLAPTRRCNDKLFGRRW